MRITGTAFSYEVRDGASISTQHTTTINLSEIAKIDIRLDDLGKTGLAVFIAASILILGIYLIAYGQVSDAINDIPNTIINNP